jgi:RNA polymerase sigma-70 factor (ECF subfamily)
MAAQTSNTHDFSDQDVVARIVAGDRFLFEIIMRRHNQRLFRIARSIVKRDDEAEDVLQEAYVQAYAHLDQFEGRSQLSTWLIRIVVHEAYRRLRQARRRQMDTMALVEGTGTDGSGGVPIELAPLSRPDNPEQLAATRELARLLEGAIDTLPEGFRTVFMLRVVERLGVAETAACLEIPEETVKTRLHRARRLLQRELERHTDDALSEVHRFLGDRCNRTVAGVLARLAAAEPEAGDPK